MSIKLETIEGEDRLEWTERVEGFCTTMGRDHLIEVKFQRNLYYSLSGSTVAAPDKVAQPKECNEPRSAWIAFILYEGKD